MLGQGRAEELERGLTAHVATGGAVYLVTFTLRHRAGPDLEHVLGVLSKARERLMRSRCWRGLPERLALVGTVRATEVTYSEASGWHPHLHTLFLVERPLSNETFAYWWLQMARVWADHVAYFDESLRPDAALFGPGVDVRRVEEDPEAMAGYLLKDSIGGAGMELARPEAKRGRARS